MQNKQIFFPCPVCGNDIAYTPGRPPKKCPHCNANYRDVLWYVAQLQDLIEYFAPLCRQMRRFALGSADRVAALDAGLRLVADDCEVA